MKEEYFVEYDGFVGVIIGEYITLEGKEGVVLQQVGTKVVHVYRKDRIIKRGTTGKVG